MKQKYIYLSKKVKNFIDKLYLYYNFNFCSNL